MFLSCNFWGHNTTATLLMLLSFWWLLVERLKTNTKVRLHRCCEPFNHKIHKMKLLVGFSSLGWVFSVYFQFFVAVSFPCRQVTITASRWSAHWRFVPSSALLSPPPGSSPTPTPGPKIRSVVGSLFHPHSHPPSSMLFTVIQGKLARLVSSRNTEQGQFRTGNRGNDS